jgi:hypothetical protein
MCQSRRQSCNLITVRFAFWRRLDTVARGQGQKRARRDLRLRTRPAGACATGRRWRLVPHHLWGGVCLSP